MIMSTEPKREIIKVEIKKPVREVKITSVEKWVYNTIRSFVESSSKETYEWNIGTKLGNRVEFEKPTKWLLRIYTEISVDEEVRQGIVRPIIAAISDSRGRDVLYIAYRQNEFETWWEMVIGDSKYRINSDLKYEAIDAKVPFSRPIVLSAVVGKICEYANFPFCK